MQDEASHTTKVVNKESNLQKINVERKVNFYVTIGDSHQLINLIYKYSASSAATPDQPCLQTVPPPGGLAMTTLYTG